MQARIVRAPTRVATPLRPCGDPRLGGAVTCYGRGYSSACRPTSGSAEIGALSSVVASGSKWQLFKYEHRGPGQVADGRNPPRAYLPLERCDGLTWGMRTRSRGLGR